MMNKKEISMKFTKYAIYQLPFENENSRDLSFMSAYQVQEISDQFEFVAIIKAHSLDHVFLISNSPSGEFETLIERVQPMHSLSVGDIVHNLDTDETHVVANYGWSKINMKESV